MKKQDELLEEYAAELIKERGLTEEVPEEVAAQMRKDLLERLNNYMIAKVVKSLSEDQIKELDAIVARGKSEEAWEYVKGQIPNFEKFSLDLLIEFRKKYLNLV